MKLLIVILLVLLAMATTFLAGYNFRLQVTPAMSQGLSVDAAVDIVEQARYSHQYYLDNPSKIQYAAVKDPNHHRHCVIRYNYVLAVLRSLK